MFLLYIYSALIPNCFTSLPYFSKSERMTPVNSLELPDGWRVGEYRHARFAGDRKDPQLATANLRGC